MNSYNIAVLGGDGTGPEVIREAVKVLDVAAEKFNLKLNYTPYDLGGDRYLRTKEALPDSAVEELRKFPAILLGAIGQPDVQESINTRRGVERCLRFAFEFTRKRNKEKKLTLCGKTNVLTYAFDLWERAFHEVGQKDFPDIKRDYAHVDATTMWFVKNPEWFDVIVTDNMFGDIITDLGAMVQGGMGIAAGGNINPDGTSMFEPIGGSAPKYTGKGVINPLAAICPGQMLLDFLGERAAAKAIDDAVIKVTCEKVKSLAAGKMGFSTTQIGDMVAQQVA